MITEIVKTNYSSEVAAEEESRCPIAGPSSTHKSTLEDSFHGSISDVLKDTATNSVKTATGQTGDQSASSTSNASPTFTSKEAISAATEGGQWRTKRPSDKDFVCSSRDTQYTVMEKLEPASEGGTSEPTSGGGTSEPASGGGTSEFASGGDATNMSKGLGDTEQSPVAMPPSTTTTAARDCRDDETTAQLSEVDPDCTDCGVVRPDPTTRELVMYLHALSYKVSTLTLSL